MHHSGLLARRCLVSPSSMAVMAAILLTSGAAGAQGVVAAQEKQGNSLCLFGSCLTDELKLQAAAELRGRVEQWQNSPAGARPEVGLLRTRLGLALEWMDWGASVSGIDGRERLTATDKRTQENAVDLLEAVLYWKTIAGSPLTLHVGRQVVNVGARRLVAAPTWKNLVRSWDSVRLTAQVGSAWTGQAFVGRRVVIEANELDLSDDGEMMWFLFGTWRPGPELLADAYVFGVHDASPASNGKAITGEDGHQGRLDRYTPGVRVVVGGNKGPLAEVEAALQWGHNAHDKILAFAAEAVAGYGFDVAMTPRLQLLYSFATGDRDASDGRMNGFVPLYGSVHIYHGHLDLFRWQNMQELATIQELKPLRGLAVRTAFHAFWLQSRHDNWYNTSGKVVRSAGDGMPGGMVGVEADGMIRWSPVPYVDLELGAGYFFSRWEPSPPQNAFVYLQTIVRTGSCADTR